jgi:hypothetical protein
MNHFGHELCGGVCETLQTQSKLDRTYQIELIDKDGSVCAVVEKIIHFKKR